MAYAFPQVKIVTTACDTQLDQETCFICPGLGNFGDRYFGTDQILDSSDNDDLRADLIENHHFQPCPPDSPSVESRRSHSIESPVPSRPTRNNPASENEN